MSVDVGVAAVSGASVVIADDHYPTRERLRRCLVDAGLDVAAAVGDADSAVEAAELHRPDICLLDVNMPGGGIAATARIAAASPATLIVMLTVSRNDDDLFDALQAGAFGYLLKDVPLDAVPGLVRAALEGEAPISGRLATRLVEEFRERGRRRRILARHAPGTELTRREWQVLELLVEHHTTTEIAERLFVEPVTVRTHVASIMRKLRVPSRQAAVRLFRAADHLQYPW